MTNRNLSMQQRRIVIIDQVLRARTRATLERIQQALKEAELPSSRRTVQRDMDHMRDTLKAPIDDPQVSDAYSEGVREYYYRYTDPTWKLGDILVDKDDILAMTLARELLRHTVGSPGADALKKTYDKLLGLADDNVRQAANTLVPIAFSGGNSEPVKPEVWNAVLDGIRARKSLRLTYNSGWKKPTNPSRLIDPYYIVNLAGEWYLLGTAGLNDNSLRQYKMARISSPIVTKASFTMPADFNIDSYLENVFGRFVGDPKTLVNIKVQFSERVVPLIREQKFQQKETRTYKNKDVIVEFPISPAGPWPFYHVISWILSWGSDAKVLAPPELRKLVRDECRRMTAAN